MPENDAINHDTLMVLAADIVSAHVSNNSVAVGDLPILISSVYSALAGATKPMAVAKAAPEPAVPVRSSVKHDYIVCLEDGRKLKMLKRYLSTKYDMTPDQYRARWNLSADYPMVAPAYAAVRRDLAKVIGLGRKPGVKVAAKPAAKRGRKIAGPAA